MMPLNPAVIAEVVKKAVDALLKFLQAFFIYKAGEEHAAKKSTDQGLADAAASRKVADYVDGLSNADADKLADKLRHDRWPGQHGGDNLLR
jgi:hypothetical protein